MATTERDEAFREAYPTLFGRAYQAAFRICGDREVAKDVAQETLTRAYVHWPKLDDRREGWVVATAGRVAIDRWRKEQRRPSESDTAAGAPIDAVTAQRIDLARLVAALPRRQREVVVLRYLEDWPERDVAAALGCSLGTVKRHASRGAAALRAVLEAPAKPATEAH